LTGVLSVLGSNDHDNLSWISRRVLPYPVSQLWWQLREESEGVEGRVRGQKLWKRPAKELNARHASPGSQERYAVWIGYRSSVAVSEESVGKSLGGRGEGNEFWV
jgi:hypothetical protein